MASDRERFKIRNSLICLLKAVEGKVTTVELRNESTVSGFVEHVDAYMNVTMTDVSFRNYKGKVSSFEQFFVQGINIRFVQIPDEVDMKKAIEFYANLDRKRAEEIREELRNATMLKMQRKERNYKKSEEMRIKKQMKLRKEQQKGEQIATIDHTLKKDKNGS
ncbi:U7 snRNA-associated Sm-like protein LSm10 [Mizuhopecten yessoensis]|uniref:U7 snRNA-associated Sm-like protein LSm10 n=1 Tax=Mizuhopecten yessoensis TaxID=6573 RepID=A0A210QQF6_MIZYE|nr:U7 snRNA-associated Sm-like protein LSm10 [Mizuhopecten yessoensis]OWF50960.1 U7 snRNA-associated Sm-like protein LSm10 [Mizuhopecten yessoensis]